MIYDLSLSKKKKKKKLPPPSFLLSVLLFLTSSTSRKLVFLFDFILINIFNHLHKILFTSLSKEELIILQLKSAKRDFNYFLSHCKPSFIYALLYLGNMCKPNLKQNCFQLKLKFKMNHQLKYYH